jgi:hypothetical protein
MLIFGLLLSALLVVGGVVLYREIHNAPEGFEDRDGFHFVSPFKLGSLVNLTALGSDRKPQVSHSSPASRIGLATRRQPSRREALANQAN